MVEGKDEVDKQRDVNDLLHQHDVEPPGSHITKLDNPLLLVLQTLYLIVIFIPVILYSFIESFFVKPKSLKGKVVLITGSGRGLGRGFAMKFAQLGCRVACADINDAINQQTVLEINEKYGPGKAIGYSCNIGVPKEIAELRNRILQDLGPVDVLVHNAGLIASTPSITDFEDLYLHGIITVNLSSHFLMIREFLPDMIKRNQGHIVAVASVAGFVGMANSSMYVAAKHGVMGLMESLHYELQDIPNNQVKTSVICPWFVNTSALYQKFWKLRLPELTIDQAVNEAVAGIRINKRIITCPAAFYYLMHITKFLPDRLNDIIRSIYPVKIEAPSMEFQKKMPLYKLLMRSFKDYTFEFEDEY